MSRILLNKAFNREKRSAIFLLTSQTLKGGLNRRLEKIENKQNAFAHFQRKFSVIAKYNGYWDGHKI